MSACFSAELVFVVFLAGLLACSFLRILSSVVILQKMRNFCQAESTSGFGLFWRGLRLFLFPRLLLRLRLLLRFLLLFWLRLFEREPLFCCSDMLSLCLLFCVMSQASFLLAGHYQPRDFTVVIVNRFDASGG